MAFAMLSPLSSAAEPCAAGFDKLDAMLKSARDQLDAVKLAQDVPIAMAQIAAFDAQMDADVELKAVLTLSMLNCPAELKSELREAIELRSLLQDAAKRLAMSGLLSRGDAARDYSEFFAKIALSDELVDELGHEGAPSSAIANRDERLQWWRDAKFGMFVHYGLYSGMAGSARGRNYAGCVEWIQMRAGLSAKDYAAEALPKFDPKPGNPTKWVALAKSSGCKYVVLTSRHHEGFNLWDTKGLYDFNVVSTKGVDVIQEYSQACENMGMKAGYYFSLIDWGHPDYDPTGSGISYPKGCYAEAAAGTRKFGNHARYKKYMHDVFSALVNKYHVDLVWWDFSQPNFQGDEAWGATDMMKTLFDAHPKAVQNNRLYHSENHLSEGGIQMTPHHKGDFSTAEHHIPATGINGDWEACQTLNGTWGYSAQNQSWKSSVALIRELCDTVSRGGNFLLNIGPDAQGNIPPASVTLFKEIGAWMDVNGDAIYETRATYPLPAEPSWGRVTRKGDHEIYLLVYNRPADGMISFADEFDGRIEATLLSSGKALPVSRDAESKTCSISLGDIEMDPAVTVIKIKAKRVESSKGV